MAKKVMQYEMRQVIRQNVSIPLRGKILTVQNRYGVPTLYALVDDDQLKCENKSFIIMQTGVPVGFPEGEIETLEYLSTYDENAFGKSFSVFVQKQPLAMVSMVKDANPPIG